MVPIGTERDSSTGSAILEEFLAMSTSSSRASTDSRSLHDRQYRWEALMTVDGAEISPYRRTTRCRFHRRTDLRPPGRMIA